MYDLGVKYGIDPVFALAFFMHESLFGTTGEAGRRYRLAIRVVFQPDHALTRTGADTRKCIVGKMVLTSITN